MLEPCAVSGADPDVGMEIDCPVFRHARASESISSGEITSDEGTIRVAFEKSCALTNIIAADSELKRD
jgi:hypothetical protein